MNNDLNYDNSNSNKKKIIVILSLILIILVVILVYLLLHFRNNDDNKNNNVDYKENIDTNLLWVDFNAGKISADEYVKNNIYNLYDRSKLDSKYKNIFEVNIDDLVSQYISELSEETMNLYIDYSSLNFLTFKSREIADDLLAYSGSIKSSKKNKLIEDNEIKKEKIVDDDIVNEKNLNKVKLSSNGHFLLWYTDSGVDAIDESKIDEFNYYFESLIDEYKEYFGVDYSFSSKKIKNNSTYDDQIEILRQNGIDSKYLEESMSIYFYDLKNDSIAGVYHSLITDDSIVKMIQNNFNDSGIFIYPYVVLNVKYIQDGNLDLRSSLAHEIFHHYQNYIIDNIGDRNAVSDSIIGEATANWASAKNNYGDESNSLSVDSSNYLNHPGSIFTEMYEAHGPSIGYALFHLLNAYEKNVNDGLNKILKSIHEKDGFKYLNDNASDDDRNRTMEYLALKNLNGDYDNNNYLPTKGKSLKIRKDFEDNDDFGEVYELSAAGLEYYSFSADLKKDYDIEISSSSDDIYGYIISFFDGEYKVIDNLKMIDNKIKFNTNDYKDYDILYVVISNINFSKNIRYTITCVPVSEKMRKTYDTSINNYKFKATTFVETYGIETSTEIDGIVDQLHQLEYLESSTEVWGFSVKTTSYVDLAKGITYTNDSITNSWEQTKSGSTFIDLMSVLDKLNSGDKLKKISEEEYIVKLDKNDIIGMMEYNEYLHEINFKGDIDVHVYVKDNVVYKLEYDFSDLIDDIDKFTMSIEFYDYNKAGDISIPIEVKY